ncbi:MAG: hypothetical protein JWN04_2807 [Myxococcaceae bacterium]|nr:hypothetical protein [Myxococcaceae bacterium]
MQSPAQALLRAPCARAATLVVLLACAGSCSTRARAAGLEDTLQGATGIARAANYVHGADFLATWLNPANLAVVPGLDLGVELRVTHFHACYDRAYDPSVQYRRPTAALDFEGTESVAEVCNHGPLGPGGNLGFAQAFASGIGYGIGLFTPAAGAGNTAWGNDTIVSLSPSPDERYAPTLRGVEAPTRQMGIDRAGIGAYLAAGVGWAPSRYFRLGGSGALGFLRVQYRSVGSTRGGTFLDQEILQSLSVVDRVMPRATVSTVVTPRPWLELFAGLTYQSDFHGKGHVDLTANGIRGAPLKNCRSRTPGTHCRIEGIELTVPFPTLELNFGVRIAHRRPGAEGRNPQRNEVWDLELDASWSQTSHVDALRTKLYSEPAPHSGETDRRPHIQLSSWPDSQVTPYTPSPRFALPRHWRDTWTVRVGSDYNVLIDKLTLHAGLSFATSAVSPAYMGIDSWPMRKVGLHTGVTVIFGRTHLTLAYAHLFYQRVEVPVGTGQLKEVAPLRQDLADAVNEGTFSASLDVLSLQLSYKL